MASRNMASLRALLVGRKCPLSPSFWRACVEFYFLRGGGGREGGEREGQMRGRCLLKKNSGGTLPCCRTGARVQQHMRGTRSARRNARGGAERDCCEGRSERERGGQGLLYLEHPSLSAFLSLSQRQARCSTWRQVNGPRRTVSLMHRQLVLMPVVVILLARGGRVAVCGEGGRRRTRGSLSLFFFSLARMSVCICLARCV